MLIFRGVILSFLVGIVLAQEEDSDIAKFMRHMQVIPDVILDGPPASLRITYDSGVVADKGVELTPTQVKNQPKVKWDAEPDAFYTLIMTDPDAPSRSAPAFREWHHWLVGNIPGDNIQKGDILTDYVGSGPPEGTGLHRYIFLLYQQPGRVEFDETPIPNISGEGRAHFSTRQFAEKYNLGAPIAGNFYQAQYDNYVPELYRQLGY